MKPHFTIVLVLVILLSGTIESFAWANDCWLSPQGNGLKNGTSAENAYAPQQAQKCFKQTGPDGTMHVLAGLYSSQKGNFLKLDIHHESDGSSKPESYKTILGEGDVKIEGTRPIPYQIQTKDAGNSWIRILKGASNLSIQNFQVSRVEEGITAKEGGNSKLEFKNIRFEDTRQNVVIVGHPQCVRLSSCPIKPEEASHDIQIENVSGLRYSKRHIRLANGVWKVQVLNSHADAAFLDGDFAVGFDVENPSHDIGFKYCTSRGNIYSLSEYWNGDGFKAENETQNIRWDHCAAFDNADGGFDIKSDNAIIENSIALRNARNIRSWSSKKIILRNINASYSKHWGGIATEAGIWSQGELDCYFCTLHNNKIQLHAENNNGIPSHINLYDSILSMDKTIDGEMLRQEKNAEIQLIRTVTWNDGLPAENPKYGAGATANWNGDDQEFDSQLYTQKKGYHYVP